MHVRTASASTATIAGIKARENGKPLLAEEITRVVIELSDQADAMDRGESEGVG